MLSPEIITDLSDEEIVTRTLHDRSYFEVIVERFEEKLQRYIRRLGVSVHEDRQDLLQEIFIKVYKNLNGFDRNLSFSSWIYRIAHNEVISWYRKKSVRPEGHMSGDIDELFLFIPDTMANAEQLVDSSIDAKLLHQALTTLEARYRDPIILRFFEYKEYDEISDILKIPIGTVGTLISRGKKKLESLLSPTKLSVTPPS
ncbi:MAG: sigma-70 family RNA polymerase sigma factor [Patescibacteria group bacterium]